MGVVTVSSSASRSTLGLGASFSPQRSSSKRTIILAFKTDKTQNSSLVSLHEPVPLPIESSKETRKRIKRTSKSVRRVKAVATDEISPGNADVDYNEAAAKLESIYKLGPPSDVSDLEDTILVVKKGRRRVKKNNEDEEKIIKQRTNKHVVRRNQFKKVKRLSLVKRIEMSRKSTDGKVGTPIQKKLGFSNEDEEIERLVRQYSVSDVSLDWKKVKIPPVLPASEHAWLFKLMQPMKALFQVKENLQKSLGREPSDLELAEATSMSANQVRKHVEVGQAARFKLIKHNLRLVLFVINKYFQEFANSPRFHDLCQAGVNGLMTAIDRFEPKRKFRLSTYGLFWIRHAVIRSMTVSSFTRVSFGLESVRVEIFKAKLELMFELNRMPTENEIVERVRISPKRYHEVLRAAKPVLSLHARHAVTQEEFINGITDTDGGGDDKSRHRALLRLALDDVLDSLKPKESLVIRQRYGLDGKGDRTLGEIAGNLNISREMVRKHEVKALMKLKHPTRTDYLRQYII